MKTGAIKPLLMAGGLLAILALACGCMPKPQSESVETKTREIDGMVMVYVPAGEFKMGSKKGEPDEKPVHKVYLDAYWIDQTEVTNGMWAKCVAAGVCPEPRWSDSNARSSYYDNATYEDYPVVFVYATQAIDYCNWAGGRMPTEAEWEKAARGMDGRKYPWGNEAPDASRLNYKENEGDTTAVGSYPTGASPYGALDMAGNVWEWTADWYDGDYYSSSPYENPQGSSDGDSRVLRGGSFMYPEYYVRSSYRGSPYAVDNFFGFRCVSAP